MKLYPMFGHGCLQDGCAILDSAGEFRVREVRNFNGLCAKPFHRLSEFPRRVPLAAIAAEVGDLLGREISPNDLSVFYPIKEARAGRILAQYGQRRFILSPAEHEPESVLRVPAAIPQTSIDRIRPLVDRRELPPALSSPAAPKPSGVEQVIEMRRRGRLVGRVHAEPSADRPAVRAVASNASPPVMSGVAAAIEFRKEQRLVGSGRPAPVSAVASQVTAPQETAKSGVETAIEARRKQRLIGRGWQETEEERRNRFELFRRMNRGG